MEQQIKDRYHTTILQEAIQRYGIMDAPMQSLEMS